MTFGSIDIGSCTNSEVVNSLYFDVVFIDVGVCGTGDVQFSEAFDLFKIYNNYFQS